MPELTIPADDPNRQLSIVDPDDPSLQHLAVVGDTYTVLLSGAQTAGRFCLIDMKVPDGGGPGPHRHDFEETFHLLEGEIEFTFRGQKSVAKAGMTVNIPANAPHSFKNVSGADVRMLCLCAPAGQEEFFARVGAPVESRTAPAPKLSPAEFGAFLGKAAALAPEFHTELLKP
ncbi:cupin domain-containing protein [Mesorhizobium sp. BH1-1-4]|uniref:cupin domain-containing protein n=1 Tax=Mesorhizobium sp. BH1-1-4 TaxID=2876662 RepID=UPI001CD08399|nr:cupin domain-containing protein [Mesorhizobium sp. BH1-1-4]MBZ9998336.1 cupin domain-containing protein [Mesorhizobium sp. BH1-1-4]